MYTINIDYTLSHDKCFYVLHDDSWLWYKRLCHANMNLISKIYKNDFIKGLPKMGFKKDRVCDACQFGKQVKASFKDKYNIFTSKPLQHIHMDLFDPST